MKYDTLTQPVPPITSVEVRPIPLTSMEVRPIPQNGQIGAQSPIDTIAFVQSGLVSVIGQYTRNIPEQSDKDMLLSLSGLTGIPPSPSGVKSQNGKLTYVKGVDRIGRVMIITPNQLAQALSVIQGGRYLAFGPLEGVLCRSYIKDGARPGYGNPSSFSLGTNFDRFVEVGRGIIDPRSAEKTTVDCHPVTQIMALMVALETSRMKTMATMNAMLAIANTNEGFSGDSNSLPKFLADKRKQIEGLSSLVAYMRGVGSTIDEIASSQGYENDFMKTLVSAMLFNKGMAESADSKFTDEDIIPIWKKIFQNERAQAILMMNTLREKKKGKAFPTENYLFTDQENGDHGPVMGTVVTFAEAC